MYDADMPLDDDIDPTCRPAFADQKSHNIADDDTVIFTLPLPKLPPVPM